MINKTYTKISVHWSAGSKTTTAEDIERIHTIERKPRFTHIGYHRVIEYPNHVPTTKPSNYKYDWSQYVCDTGIDGKDSIAVAGMNTGMFAICVVGNTNYPLHWLQKEVLIQCLKYFTKKLNIPKTHVKGHLEYPKQNTACPGPEILQTIKDFRDGKYDKINIHTDITPSKQSVEFIHKENENIKKIAELWMAFDEVLDEDENSVLHKNALQRYIKNIENLVTVANSNGINLNELITRSADSS